ncbi:MAG TPA: amidohydrolase family protein [Candidatus Binatia bacterium]|jgi:N-acyl-D-aspartate/D-glutamate deacylase|nr:amidohydrolase family protein [Candidatus Binatia bacterium]
MHYDLIIKNGTLIDGSGLPRYRADVGIRRGKIATIGKLRDGAKEVLDAEGHIVAPGFIDAHTHMDAQVFWDPLGTCSCWHGITSVVMGNCGFSLAPCGEKDKLLVMRNLERAEDIAPEAMEAGIKWSWTTYPEYLDAVDSLPKGINYAAYMGHSALRTYVMGERAFTEAGTPDDVEAMKREVRNAIRAGAIGFTTSRTRNHQTPDGQPVASRLATWDEVRQLVGVMGKLNAGIFEIAGEDTGLAPERIQDYLDRLKALAVDTGVPVTFGMFSNRKAPDYWRPFFTLADETAAAGGRMFLQVHSRSLNVVLSFETVTPFDKLPVWREIRKLPLAEQEAKLRDPEIRQKLVEAVYQTPRDSNRKVGPEPRSANFKWLFVMDKPTPPHRSIAEIAAEQNKNPVEVFIDAALEKHLKQFFLQPLANENQDHALEMIKHPRSVVTFSDSGAHVSQIMDSSLQTHLLSHWVREKQAVTLEEAVRMLSFVPASHWGLAGRGLLREGWAADVVVFDPDTVAPTLPELTYDLPAGARRLKQKATGFMASVVNGAVVLRNNEHTGALPGKLLRGPLARARK